MKVQSKKEGKFLVFNFDDGANGIVKYDLATQEYIGKKGKPVKNLCSQFRGYTIDQVINSFEEEAYKKFLKHVYEKSSRGNYYSNVGTFLTKVSDYANYEQFFSAGISRISVSNRTTISDVPKKIMKMCRENPETMPLNDTLISNYKENIDLFNLIYSVRGSLEMFDATKLMYDTGYYRYSHLHKVKELIDTYNYNPKALLKYIDNIMIYEGVNDFRDVISELHDYAVMSRRMSPKFDKYPKYLRTVHDITSRNYNRLKEVFDEQAFKDRMRKDMEFSYKDYVFIYPNATADIKQEAVNQSNCVASYVQKIIDGHCHIMFMRHKGKEEESLVTLEISTQTDKVVQEKGRYNRDTTQEEKEAIQKFNKYLKKLKEEKGAK